MRLPRGNSPEASVCGQQAHGDVSAVDRALGVAMGGFSEVRVCRKILDRRCSVSECLVNMAMAQRRFSVSLSPRRLCQVFLTCFVNSDLLCKQQPFFLLLAIKL